MLGRRAGKRRRLVVDGSSGGWKVGMGVRLSECNTWLFLFDWLCGTFIYV